MQQQYWGNHGEYGPFTTQEDGWPHAGEVIRYFRRQRVMSADELAKRYSEATGATITKRWILKMEQQNKVPTDMTRRHALITILEIPAALLGLASLDHLRYQATPTPASATPYYTSFDLERKQRDARLFWTLHYTQTAQDVLPELFVNFRHLAPIQQNAQGNLKHHLSELLNSYARLVATIQRDRGNFEEAYQFANEGVRYAKESGNNQIFAASQYTRGVVNMAWGIFGKQVKQGKITIDHERIKAAYRDFERATLTATPQLKGILFSEMARLITFMAPSPTEITIAYKLLEQAEHFVTVDTHDDFYEHILFNGDMKGLDQRRLTLSRVKMLLAINRPGKAREELVELEMMKEPTSNTRRSGWTSLLYAQTAFALGDYATSVDETIRAFHACHEVHSMAHLARINHFSLQLQAVSPKEAHVKQLRKLLNTVFPDKNR